MPGANIEGRSIARIRRAATVSYEGFKGRGQRAETEAEAGGQRPEVSRRVGFVFLKSF
jgi:hypothetical protein